MARITRLTSKEQQHEENQPMIAAIYSRKSTEQSGVADDAKLVTRQIEHAKAYCASKAGALPTNTA